MASTPPMPAAIALCANVHDDMFDMLSELRILFPSAQMLTAFLIILPFNSSAREFLENER